LCEGYQGFSAEALTMSQAGDLFDRAKLTSTFTGKQRWWLGLSDFIREGVWHWSYSYDAAVNVSEFASIWEPNLEDGNANDCVVMALEDGSLSWVDIHCLDTTHDGQDIQAICQCKGTSCVSPTTETTPATTMETTTVHTCAEGWSPTETLGCVIALSEPAGSLKDARAACSSVNGYLVEALNNDNEAELETVAEVLHSVLAPWSWWLGLVWDGSAWVWIDALEGLTTDDKWGTDQGTGNNGEECAVITKVGTKWEWHDVACNSSEYLGVSIGVICQECTEGHCSPTTTSATTAPTEDGKTTTTSPATTGTLPPLPDDCKYSDVDNSPCYLANTDLLTFEEAEASCVSLGGHLASALTQEENDFIGHVTLSGGSNVPRWWIGAQCGTQYCEEGGSWSWTDGSPWSYENWKHGDGGIGTSYGCGFFEPSHSYWKTYNCASHFASVCKI